MAGMPPRIMLNATRVVCLIHKCTRANVCSTEAYRTLPTALVAVTGDFACEHGESKLFCFRNHGTVFKEKGLAVAFV